MPRHLIAGASPMPAIEPLSYASLDYLKSLRCVCVSSSGRVYVSRDPKGAVAAWWTKSEHADQIAHVAWTNADVPGAASRLGLTVTPHSVVCRRVGERTAALDKAIAEAIDSGTLKAFNAEYRKRRLAAKQNGQRFMSYSEAQARLCKVIAGAVARGGEIPPSFIAGVFEQA
jgi:hypothetical protein